jgi:diaminopimelate decarboxylase
MKHTDSFLIQGISPHDICQEFGTPLYVYDANVIKK